MEYNESTITNFQKSISNSLEPLYELQEQCLKTLDPIFHIQKQYSELLQSWLLPYENIWKTYQHIAHTLCQSIYDVENIYLLLLKQLSDIYGLSFNTLDESNISSNTCTNCIPLDTDSYIELSQSTFTKIEENIIEIPKDLYIKTSMKTFRIRSDFIIAVLGLLISIIFGIIPTIQSINDSKASTEKTLQEFQQLEKQTDLLSEILDTATTSDKETAELLHNLQQSVDTGNSLYRELLEVLDSAENIPRNNTEPDCNCLNTASKSDCN